MRISDWSSDVCSSDLSRADTGKGGQSLLDDKTRGTAGDFQRSLRARRTLDAISAVRIAPGGLTMQRYYVLDREMAAGEDGFEAMVARAYRLKQARSEEHTSELQSLMRISYAVFCLKKKNNKDIYMHIIKF